MGPRNCGGLSPTSHCAPFTCDADAGRVLSLQPIGSRLARPRDPNQSACPCLCRVPCANESKVRAKCRVPACR